MSSSREELGVGVPLEHHRLHHASAVADFEEVEFAARATVVQPAPHRDGLTDVVAEVRNRDVIRHRGAVVAEARVRCRGWGPPGVAATRALCALMFALVYAVLVHQLDDQSPCSTFGRCSTLGGVSLAGGP